MKPFFTKDFTSIKRFPIGSCYKVKVPEKFRDSHGAFDDAIVEIVSKKNFLAKYPIERIEYNKVVCKILDASSATRGVTVVGLEYPIRRAWLKLEKHKCACDTKSVLMISGCRCGGY